MDCEELIQYLSDYIDQGLTESLRQDAEAHLSTCRNCRVVLDTTQRTILLFREQQKPALPAVRREHLFRMLQEAYHKRTEE